MGEGSTEKGRANRNPDICRCVQALPQDEGAAWGERALRGVGRRWDAQPSPLQELSRWRVVLCACARVCACACVCV